MMKRLPFRWFTRGAIALAMLSACTALHAQAPQPQQPRPATTNQPADPTSSDQSNSGLAAPSGTDTTRTSLTAAQIDDLLQQKPELIVDLKSLVADQLQQQGISVQADAITDEMLYRQIASSAEVRANITVWLRARGYVSGTEPRTSLDDTENDSTDRLLDRSNDRSNDRTQIADPTVADALSRLQGTGSLQGTSQSDATATGTSQRQRQLSNPTSQRAKQQEDKTHNITDEPEVLRQPAPYNLLALRDLYTQVPQDDAKLKRFGSEVFLNRSSSTSGGSAIGPREAPMDVPVGPDYVLGVGDGITINIWGGVSQSFTRTLDREGKIVLPEAGSLVVAGLTLEHAQSVIESALKHQFRDARVDVTIARLRTVRIYVVGDVQRPGAYDLTSLSTPLNALYAAGGPTAVGSLRIVRHYRGQQLLREVDLYDFLLHGLRMDDERLASGDTLLIPPEGPQVAVFGAVKRPAIYELKGNETLAEMLTDAGGATVAAALNHITIERIQPNQQRETVNVDIPASSTPEATQQIIAAFNVKDGDRIHVAPILPYSERAVYLEGHVARPGKYPWHDGMRLSDVVRSYQDLLPEPASRAEIVRLVPPDLHAETIQFDVADVMIGNANLALQPFDTIRITGRYQVDSPQVAIRGEVLRPGPYALSRDMTVAQLVKMAGGFKRDALLDSADLTSYTIQDGKKIVSQRTAVSIGAAMLKSDPSIDLALKPGDILTIHQISGWNDIGASVDIQGEMTYPGSYGLQEGERLSSVLRRAGGFRTTAYPDGAILVRKQVQELEEKSRAELIRQIETTSVSARLAPSLSAQDETAALQAAQQQQNEVLQRLRSEPASGRLVLHISSDIASWENTPADIELRSDDVLTVPKRPSFVLVTGQVYNASAITFIPGKTAGWYLSHAGGANDVANKKDIFIVRANGSVVGRRSGGAFSSNVLGTHLDPGDVIVVPQKFIGGSLAWRNLLTVAQIASSIAITAAVAGLL